MAGTNDLYSKAIGDMVQGVSQQAPELRRDSQAESQFDCLNSPESGVTPRPHFEFVFQAAGKDYTNAFFYEQARGNSEHYLSIFTGTDINVYDLSDGTPCTVTETDTAYLSAGATAPRDVFDVQCVDDYSFTINKTIKPAMTADVVPVRPPEALAFFRGGAYSNRFSLALTFGGKVYTWVYNTPDNSTSANAAYIATNQIAGTFYRAMTGTAAPIVTSGDSVTATSEGLQANHVGDTSTTGAITATSLGFSVQITGNLLRIWRTDGQDFEIDSSDGNGDSLLRVLKGKIQSFSDLPRNGFTGMVFQVSGADKSADDDYFVQYQSAVMGNGVWAEIAAPGAHTTLDPATMPHALVNTDFRTFTWGPLTWSTRDAGDEQSAKDPYFVGKALTDISFYQNRLLLVTEGAVDFSKASNEFTFYPDTMQTVLDTDRISVRLTAAGNARNQGASLLRKAVQFSESLYLWAQRAQFRVFAPQGAFTPATVQSAGSTSYEFTETVDPLSLGQKLYVLSEAGSWSRMRAVEFANGLPSGDIDLTAHVPRYIPAGARDLSGFDSGRKIFVRSDATANYLYCYQYLQDGDNLVQSAWNTWRLPAGTILWSSVYRSGLYVALQRADGLLILRAELDESATDPGGDYTTRLDLRVSEANCTVTVNAGVSTIQLPYALQGGMAGKPAVFVRTDLPGGYTRGRAFDVLSAEGNLLTVKGDLTGYQFYAGLLYTAERTESTFFIRTQGGPVSTDRLQVRALEVIHSSSTYYRVEVNVDGADPKVSSFDGRVLGTSSGVTGTPQLSSGKLLVAVDGENTSTTIRLVNDSPFPSAWVSSQYRYTAAIRPTPNKFQ